ncbi:MAG: Ig-like domain-containing protein [Parcubacteria group bacterium]|nr:Ig-like domain-containing protein [Parcubacteria group bacterium]
MKEEIIQFLSRFKRLLVAAALLVLIFIIIAVAVNFWPRSGRKFSRLIIDSAYAQNNFAVTATASDAAGIDSATAFIIKSQQAIDDAGWLKSNLKIIPEVEFDLKKVTSHEFRLLPKTGLAGRQVYRLLIASSYVNNNGLEADRNFSWAFQVKDQFKILHTLPADKATEAPVNSGIEITFSHDNFINFENSFVIEPKVEGRFEKHGRTAVFMPLKPLSAGKIYTVKIMPAVGIEGSSEKLASLYSFQFETAFARLPQPSAYISFMSDKYEFGLKQIPAFSVFINNNYANRRVRVNLYNYPTRQKFVDELKKIYDLPAWSNYRNQLSKQADTADLVKTASYDLVIAENNYDNILALPQTLPAGFYLLEAKLGETTSFVRLQITDISAYTQVNKNKILLWVNRLGSAEPIAGASVVDLKTNASIATNQNGAVLLNNSSSAEYQINYYAISSDGQTLVMPVYLADPDYDQPNNRYWNYFYPDRALYKPTDTVNFWGFIKPRQTTLAKPKEAIIRLEKSGYNDYYDQPIVAAEQKVNLSDNGFFTGQIKFANLTPASYNLTVNLAGEKLSLENRYLQVMAYVKPAYKIIVTPKQAVLFSGEPAVYDIKTAFFEGTPAPNIELRYSHEKPDGSSEQAVIKTNQLGQANLSFPTIWPDCQEDCYFLKNDNLSVSPVRGEFGEINGQANLTVIGPKIKYNKTEAKAVNPETAEVSAEVKTVDINNEPDNYNGGPAANIKITVKIKQIEYLAKANGAYYDFINKVSYPIYNYTPKKTVLPDVIIITNAAGAARGQFKIDPDKAYEIIFYAPDTSGKVIATPDYIYNSRGYNNDPRYENYFLQAKDGHDSYYKIGETINLELVKNKQAVIGGQTLFTRQQLGLWDYQVKNSGDYDFVFEDKQIPNINVYAVWFDGKTYHESGGFNAMIKSETRELKIDLKTDKTKYAPADQAIIDIKVTDPAGLGVSSEVNLNIVDQAFLQLGGGSDASPLNVLSPVDSGFWYSFYSHNFPSANGGAEKGGGGGEARADFPDLALFQSVKTDINGRAQVKFKLPDSVTAWSVTAQAISDNIYAGTGSAIIKVSLPFFIQPSVAEEYLSSDQPVVRANAYGDALKANGWVWYKTAHPPIN